MQQYSKRGNIHLCFERNGTGKLTIAQAVRLASQMKPLTELAPYGLSYKDLLPSIEGVNFKSTAIFDDEYISQYVFQPDTLLKDTFEILIRSKEYDKAKENIDEALSKIKTAITGRQEIIKLQQQIGVLIDTIRFTSGNKIMKRGGAKGLLEGKGAYFNSPGELSELKPFFEEDTVSKWAAWRLQGYTEYGAKGRCSYCSVSNTAQTNTINRLFTESCDKASGEAAAAILKALDELIPYLGDDKVTKLILSFGMKEDLNVLETPFMESLLRGIFDVL